MFAMCVMCWFIIHKTLQWLYLLCYYFVLVALFVVYICTWTLFSFYARPYVFTARCTLVQSAVLRSHVVCLSVCLSVCNVGEL